MKKTMKVDRISSLPDDLLIHVLSFLRTKEAVQTCILSPRWRRVWANLPILKFHIYEFGVDDSVGGNEEELKKFIAKFEQFVSAFVKNREPTHLDRVCYVHDTARTNLYIVPMQRLDRVAILMSRLIDVSIAIVDSLDFSASVFSSATLQHLQIQLHAVNKTTVIPASINLPSLKAFYITGVVLHDNFAPNLLMGCPSLEILTLSFCNLHFSTITSEVLKELNIVGCHQYEPMQISCPSLLSLKINSYLVGGAGFSLKNMKSLKRASIGLTSTDKYFGGGDLTVVNFLGGLSNATQLMLLNVHINSPEQKVQLERDFLNCRNFNNMKELFIGMYHMSFDFNLVAILLRLSPNVKKLSLMLDVNQVAIQEGHSAIQEEHRQEVLGDVLFQHKYIEIVKISDWYDRKLPQVLIEILMKNLNTYVKEIGNVIIE